MPGFELRPMQPGDREGVAELICLSTNYWYQAHGHPPIFPGGPQSTALFFDVYHALEGSAGLVAQDTRTGFLLGSCFYHLRPTHLSLGIMNAHPNHFGRGVARALLDHIVGLAQTKPLRLVSSAMNLDSFSLYTRAGFVPRCIFQDLFLPVPAKGLPHPIPPQIRPATLADVAAMAELELEISHVRRDSDYRHFIENPEGIWHTSVWAGPQGALEGFLVSCGHPGSNLLGPGVARTQEQAAGLILAELDQHRGRSPVFLVPAECADLVSRLYAWGARNCELHLCQVRGAFSPFSGVAMPTFMPESG